MAHSEPRAPLRHVPSLLDQPGVNHPPITLCATHPDALLNLPLLSRHTSLPAQSPQWVLQAPLTAFSNPSSSPRPQARCSPFLPTVPHLRRRTRRARNSSCPSNRHRKSSNPRLPNPYRNPSPSSAVSSAPDPLNLVQNAVNESSDAIASAPAPSARNRTAPASTQLMQMVSPTLTSLTSKHRSLAVLPSAIALQGPHPPSHPPPATRPTWPPPLQRPRTVTLPDCHY